ncbi:MAG TPA: hypothetical protein VFG20_22730 [Planctomycetaceae bacterium]|nr:hypothetical protein [Planctomycetaceae bacterium]
MQGFTVLWALLITVATTTNLTAAPPRINGVKSVARSILKFERDYVPALTEDGPLKKGDVLELRLLSGKVYSDMELVDVQRAKEATSFRGLTFKPGKGQPAKLAPNTLSEIRVKDGGDYDVVADPTTKAWVLLDRQKRDTVAEERLANRRHSLWKPATTEEQTAAIKHFDELADKVQKAFPTQKFVRQETQYFIVYTDMPFAQIGGYIANLDSMYQQLCTLFSIPKETNIWVGKCPVFCFLNREHFVQFEAEFMDNPQTQGVAGLNHNFSDGKVLTSVYRGNDPVFFASVLVHETSHGFLHRIRSSGRIPPWMNEGLAEWISQVVVPQSDHVQGRFSEALPILRMQGSLGGNFLDDEGRIESWQYGAAAVLTQFLISTDANAYRAMITAIKEGYTWQEALEVTFGLRPEDLAIAFGRSIGIPQLRP